MKKNGYFVIDKKIYVWALNSWQNIYSQLLLKTYIFLISNNHYPRWRVPTSSNILLILAATVFKILNNFYNISIVEVDHGVATEDQIKWLTHYVSHQIMLLKYIERIKSVKTREKLNRNG